MLRKFTVLILVFALLPLLIVAQQKALLRPGGKTVYLKSGQDAREVFQNLNAKYQKHIFTKSKFAKPYQKNDTLTYSNLVSWTTSSFGGYGQDVLVQWFVAPADLNILSVGYNSGDNPSTSNGSVKLYKIGNGWTLDKIKSITSAKNLGYWVAKGNGYNDLAPFEDEATEPKTWIAHSAAGATSPFAEDIWSDAGTGAPTVPNDPTEADFTSYQWIDMNLLGFYPAIKGGDIFAIILKNEATDISVQSGNTIRFGCFSTTDIREYGMFKFYCGGRTVGDTSTSGWWKREYTINMVAAVEITGDTPPSITDVSTGATNFTGTLSTDPIEITATITDENPGGTGVGAGVKEAKILYSTDKDTTTQQIAMTANGDVYSASIPGQSPGTTVTYQVRAVDVNDNVAYSAKTYTYVVFGPSGAPTLVVFNGWSGVSGYPQDYYFAKPFNYDVWAYGPMTAELVNYYTNVIEIASNGPNDINSDVVKAWLDASGTHNYMLIGDEWLGAQSGWVNGTYSAGTFQYDVLGVNADSNDVNYNGTTASAQVATLIYPQQGTTLGDSLYLAVTAANEDSLLYHPYYETGAYNFIDGLFVQADVVVDVKALGLRGETFNVGIHRTLPAGNKIVFLAFDPLALDAHPPYTNADYVWYGYETIAPQFQALHFFDIAVDVKKEISDPREFKLSQNYPNPFNPSTTISYTIPERSNVSLKVFDVLGREVLTLINGTKNSGTYEVTFDASKLSSGLYVYTLSAGNFSVSRKMMLLK